MPEPGTLSSFGERDRLAEVGLLLVGLPVGFDHDRELDEARRLHHLVGVQGERFAGRKVLDGDRDLALVRGRRSAGSASPRSAAAAVSEQENTSRECCELHFLIGYVFFLRLRASVPVREQMGERK